MDTRILIPLTIAVVVVIFIALLLVLRKRQSDRMKSEQLKQDFGPEYDRVLQQHADTRHAEAALVEREKRVEKFSIHPLPAGDRERYTEHWSNVQQRFVDDPSMAVTEADKLVTKVMVARGYPMGDFEQRAADVSVSYPEVVQNYRSAREIVVRNTNGQTTTEELRQAMVYYRSLFNELLDSTMPEKVVAIPERLAS